MLIFGDNSLLILPVFLRMEFLASRAAAYGISDKKLYEIIEKAKDIKVSVP